MYGAFKLEWLLQSPKHPRKPLVQIFKYIHMNIFSIIEILFNLLSQI